jgi:3-oxoacyl-(acyl-carrier-protein) synthase
VYAEILGYGTTNDAFDAKRVSGDGSQLARAMRMAVDRAGVETDDIDVVFADAAGVAEADRAEASAINEVFGRDVPVTAPKTMTGRLYGGGAALDVAAAVFAMRDGVIPPTINVDSPAEGCDLAFVTEAKEGPVGTVLVNARGFGGFNSSIVLRKPS